MGFRLIKVVCCVVALVAASQPAATQEANTSGPLDEAHIGRILVGGRDVCTGTLVTPSIVLTAGHCIQPQGSQRPVTDTRVKFLIKSPEDNKRRVFSVHDIGIVPDFSYRSSVNPGLPVLSGDMALLKLNGIATRSEHEQVGNPADTSGVGYIPSIFAADRSPEGAESCLTRVLDSDIMVLSCHREEGFSGSPVFGHINGERRVIGVVTARSERVGVPVLYAAIPHFRAGDIVWQKMTGSQQIRLISSGGSTPSRKK